MRRVNTTQMAMIHVTALLTAFGTGRMMMAQTALEPASKASHDLALHVEGTEPPIQARRRGPGSGALKMRIAPHWFDNDARFWYRNDLGGGRREYILVDAAKGIRAAAFDHQRLAKALSDAGVKGIRADQLPLDRLEFSADSRVVILRAAGENWHCDLTTYVLKKSDKAPSDLLEGLHAMSFEDAPRASRRTGPQTEVTFINECGVEVELFWLDPAGRSRSYGKLPIGGERVQHTFAGHVWQIVDKKGQPVCAFEAQEQPRRAEITRTRSRRSRPNGSVLGDGPRGSSPDGKWVATIDNHNVFVRRVEDGTKFALSQDGTPDDAYAMLQWSADSRHLVAFRVAPGDEKEVYLVESSPPGGGRAKLHTRKYALPGDKFASYELNLFDVASRAQKKPRVDRIDFGRPRVRWNRDGRHFTYQKTERGHQRFRLIEIDSHNGNSCTIIDETSATFIWTAHAQNIGVRKVTWLEESDEIVFVSQRDGWRHLYLIDAATGKIKNPITKGNFVVRRADLIDEAKREIWFRASGMNGDQDPYLIHYYRINFDGTGLIALTGGNGNHSVQYSPERKYLIDTYSRVNMAPVHELRRVADGRRVCELETADIAQLKQRGWKPPEVFVAKGRDGKTDIWGIICRPRVLDPTRKYPIIEDIYAGPHGSFVPKSFSTAQRYESLTKLGFIVVKIDGMGTANRSKAFHDVCWKNLKDAGLPDRIRWIKAAARKYPYMDTSRVGIYGTSAGGQSAAGAVLFHPEFYDVAVASCGCHDNRMDKASWNEQWMGYPVGPHYAACSNIENAASLQGKLLLIVGEMDTNVPPESTMRFVDALIKANKDFDLVVVPGAGHGNGGAYGRRRMHQFFVRHLAKKGQ